jgi:hypothetical protein
MLYLAFTVLIVFLAVLLYRSDRRRRLAEKERERAVARGNGHLAVEAGKWRRWE